MGQPDHMAVFSFRLMLAHCPATLISASAVDVSRLVRQGVRRGRHAQRLSPYSG